jgi:hypothetical protein
MHDCAYANAIGKPVYFITTEEGVEVCGFCHVPKTQAPKAPAKTVRK